MLIFGTPVNFETPTSLYLSNDAFSGLTGKTFFTLYDSIRLLF